MLLIYDKGLRKTTLDTTIAPWLKRSRAEQLIITLKDSFALFTLPTGASLRFKLKPKGLRDTTPLVTISLTSADLDAQSGTYRKSFSTINAAVNTALGVDSTSDNDVSSLVCEAELSYIPGEGQEAQLGDTFEVTLLNSVDHEEDQTPTALPTPDDFVGERAVRYDLAQSLSSGQKTQARANIGAAEAGAAPTAHNHDSLYFTEAEVTAFLAAKAALDSPALTGTPTAPTASPGTNSTRLATTAFVAAAVAAGGGGGSSISDPEVIFLRTNGNNTTGEIGKKDKPFQTFAGALAAMPPSDFITGFNYVFDVGVGTFVGEEISITPASSSVTYRLSFVGKSFLGCKINGLVIRDQSSAAYYPKILLHSNSQVEFLGEVRIWGRRGLDGANGGGENGLDGGYVSGAEITGLYGPLATFAAYGGIGGNGGTGAPGTEESPDGNMGGSGGNGGQAEYIYLSHCTFLETRIQGGSGGFGGNGGTAYSGGSDGSQGSPGADGSAQSCVISELNKQGYQNPGSIAAYISAPGISIVRSKFSSLSNEGSSYLWPLVFYCEYGSLDLTNVTDSTGTIPLPSLSYPS
jgi:hypothetical protein